ncbi:MAG TPA: MATE family efflux transporter, partial [Pseudomonadales bacterium]
IAWISSMVAAIWLLSFRERLLLRTRPHWQALKASWQQLMTIAVPATMSNLMTPVSLGILTALVTRYGEEAVAATGVGTRIEPVLVIVAMSMSAAMPAIIGQNYAAGRKNRVIATMMTASKFIMLWQLVMAVVLWFAAPTIANLFSDNKAVAELISFYLRCLPVSYGFLALTFVSTATFNAMKQPRQALQLNIIRLFICYLPLSFFGAWVAGVKGIYLGAAAGNILAGLVAFYWCGASCRAARTESGA